MSDALLPHPSGDPMISLGLPPEALAARRLGIGGSDAFTICCGTAEDRYRLYLEKIGEAEPKKIMSDWAYALRMATETLQLDWYEHVNPGFRVGSRGKIYVSSAYPFMRCTLDGQIFPGGIPINAKHLSPWTKQAREWAIGKYTPQITHEALVCEAPYGLISLLHGEKEPEIIRIDLDPFFAEDLIEREREFWASVEAKTPPPDCAALAVPRVAIDVKQLRTINLQGEIAEDGTMPRGWPNWAGEMEPLIRSFVATESAFKRHAIVREDIKKLLPDDVGELRRGDFTARRSKANAITMKTERIEDGNG